MGLTSSDDEDEKSVEKVHAKLTAANGCPKAPKLGPQESPLLDFELDSFQLPETSEVPGEWQEPAIAIEGSEIFLPILMWKP